MTAWPNATIGQTASPSAPYAGMSAGRPWATVYVTLTTRNDLACTESALPTKVTACVARAPDGLQAPFGKEGECNAMHALDGSPLVVRKLGGGTRRAYAIHDAQGEHVGGVRWVHEVSTVRTPGGSHCYGVEWARLMFFCRSHDSESEERRDMQGGRHYGHAHGAIALLARAVPAKSA